MGKPLEVYRLDGHIYIKFDDYPIEQIRTLQTVIQLEYKIDTVVLVEPDIPGNVDPPRLLIGNDLESVVMDNLKAWCEGFLLGFELNPKHFH